MTHPYTKSLMGHNKLGGLIYQHRQGVRHLHIPRSVSWQKLRQSLRKGRQNKIAHK
jgi:hypothetical protein